MSKLLLAISITLLVPSLAHATQPIPECAELEAVALEPTVPQGCPLHLVFFDSERSYDLAVEGGTREPPRVVTRETVDANLGRQSCGEPGDIRTSFTEDVVSLHTVELPAGATSGTKVHVIELGITVSVTAAAPCPTVPVDLQLMQCPEVCDSYWDRRDGGCSAGGEPTLALAGLALLLQRSARRRRSSTSPSRSVSERMPK